MKKKLLIILLTVFSFNAINAEVTWKISDDGTLTISGTDMPNYYTGAPWFENKDKIKKIVIENGVTNIGSGAFYHCDNLTSITIPNSVTNIGDEAFYKCSGLTSIVIPNASIGNDAFYECEALTSVTIGNSNGNSAVSIGKLAFERCSNITSLTLGNSVTSIGEAAFYGCYQILPFIIPSSVKSIGNEAFAYCSSLFSLTNLATVPQEISEGTFDNRDGKPLHVLPGCKAAYEAAEYWKDFTIIEDATTGIDAVEGPATISSDKIFSISGQRLDKAAKGVNIINGKKVLVK